LIQAVALSVATKNIGDDCAVGEPVAIAMGIHAGDHAIYPDCRQEFRDVDFEAFKAGNWDADLVYHYTPYLEVNKFDILEDGQRSCDILGLDFNEVYRRTNTSYKPMLHTVRVDDEISYEGWFSDYKSAASVERIEAFIKLGRPDPVEYADENGPVTWEVAKAHVEKVLAEHNS
jgi:7-cyano-7-deazaguanine synthase